MNAVPAITATGRARRARRRRRRGVGAARWSMLRVSLTGVDWIIVGFALLLAFNGARQGFLMGFLQLLGFAIGAVVGSRIGPLVLSGGSNSPYAPLFALGGAVLLGSLLGAGFQYA